MDSSKTNTNDKPKNTLKIISKCNGSLKCRIYTNMRLIKVTFYRSNIVMRVKPIYFNPCNDVFSRKSFNIAR